MANWLRAYQFSAGQAGAAGFAITQLHINFSVEKADVSSPNTAKIALWNLNPEHKAALEEKDCIVTLNAGYEGNTPMVLTGTVTNVYEFDKAPEHDWRELFSKWELAAAPKWAPVLSHIKTLMTSMAVNVNAVTEE